MKSRKLLATVLTLTLTLTLSLGMVSVAHASLISFATRASGSVPAFLSAGDVKAYVEGLTAAPASAGYCDAAPAAWNGLSNQTNCGGVANNIAFDISATFSVSAAQAGTWSFRIGPDFGLGGALFIDGAAVDFRATDMWWSGSYADPTQILAATLNLAAGNHVIRAYGAEACCDGAQQGQYLAPGSTDWITFGADDGITPRGLPEPASAALLLLALGAMGAARKRAHG